MASPAKYTLYLARIRFMESNKFKLRPVIVVSNSIGPFGITAVVPVSSKENLEKGDLLLRDWQNLGLKKLSVARIHRITSIAKIDLVEELGTLNSAYKKDLTELIANHFRVTGQ